MKEKIKGKLPSALIAVIHDGLVVSALEVKAQNPEQFSGDAVVTFEIPLQCANEHVGFGELEKYMTKTLGKNLTKVKTCLAECQSLTLHYVQKATGLPRDVVKMLVEQLVQHKAYVKYFSYWKRTEDFSLWIQMNWTK